MQRVINSELRYRRLFETTRDGILILDAKTGMIEDVNPYLIKILGYSREELIKKRLWEVGAFRNIESSKEAFEALLENEFIRYEDLPLKTKDGRLIEVEFVSTVYLVGDEKTIQCNIRDISEHRKIIAALQENEKKYHDLINQSPDGYFIIEVSGNILTVNKAMCKALEFNEEELLSMSIWDIIPEEFLGQYRERLTKILKGESLQEAAEYEVYGKNGNIHYVEVLSAPRYSGGNIIGFQGVARNISDRKHAERALLESEEKYRRLVEHLPTVVYTNAIGDSSSTIYVSPQIETLLGYTPNEWLADPKLWSKTLHPSDRQHALKRAGYTDQINEPFDMEYRMVARDGRLVWVHDQVTLVYDLKGQPIYWQGIMLDITERKEMETALVESEHRLVSIYNTVGDVIYQLAVDKEDRYRFTSVNKAFLVKTGLTSSQVIGKLVDEIIQEPSLSLVMEKYATAIREKKIVTWEEISEYPAGKLTGEVGITPVFDEAGHCNSLIGSVHDITERKQAENKLIASEVRYRRLFESAKDGILILDADTGEIIDVNPFLKELLGYSQSEFLGKQLWEIGIFKDMAANKESFQKLQAKKYIRYENLPLESKDGRTIWVEFVSNVYAVNGGQVVQCNIHDITERKRAEAQIQHQLEHLNSLRAIDIAISSSFDTQVVLDIVLQQVLSQLGTDAAAILLINPHLQTIQYAASRGFRSNAIQHTNLKFGDGYAGRAVLERKLIHAPQLMAGGGELSIALQLANENFVDYYGMPLIVKGEIKGVLEIYHRVHLNPDPEWLGFLETLARQTAIAIDNAQLFDNLQRSNTELEHRVTQRTAELNQTNIELEHANRAKDEFLATMSHELRTPLNSILGLSEALLEQMRDPLSAHQQRSLRMIEASGSHLLELINDILDLSKIEAGKFDYYPQVVGVDDLCRSSLTFVQEQATRKSITLTYQQEASVSKVYADPRRLKQILVNLLTNAVKFTPENGQVILQVDGNAEQDRIQFSVIDTGIGIAPEDLKKLFQPFVQVDSRLTREYEGTGLGLALVQKLTDVHGGSVNVESEPGKGSRFTVNLSIGQAIMEQLTLLEAGGKPATEQTVNLLDHPAEPSTQHATILLAEDNMANVLTMGDYLESHGYQVSVAHDGVEALEKAEATDPDIILMDIQMPVMDGLEATRHLRANPRFAATPIIALTALAMSGDRERCLEAGASEYMSKPVSLKSLVKIIETMIHPGKSISI